MEQGPGQKGPAGMGGVSRRKQQEVIEVEGWKKVMVERELRGGGAEGSSRKLYKLLLALFINFKIAQYVPYIVGHTC